MPKRSPARPFARPSARRRITVSPSLEAIESRLLMAVLTVNSTDNTNINPNLLSLARAIDLTNGTIPLSSLTPTAQLQVVGSLAAANTIEFNIPGAGVQTIMWASPYIISQPVTIDGYTQSDASANNLAVGNDAVLRIQLSGGINSFPVNGFEIDTHDVTLQGLVINGYTGDGVVIENDVANTGNVIRGNFIGVDPTGTTAVPNLGIGIEVDSSSNSIGGASAAARNIISGNGGEGVELSGVSDTTVQGNYIGTNAAGTAALPNQTGLLLTATGNTIGGPSVLARNVISGNNGNGVTVSFPQNVLQGNYIGTNAAGTAAVPNTGAGVSITDQADNTTVGGTTRAAGNLISGNGSDGITVLASDSVIQNNFIGTNAAGTAAVGNARDGVGFIVGFFSVGTGNLVGGPDPGLGNVISGNGRNGVLINGAMYFVGDTVTTDDEIQGNLIGVNAAGTAALGNGGQGVLIQAAAGNSVGGATAGAGNVIGGNVQDGVRIATGFGSTTLDAFLNLVSFNAIGVSRDGSVALPNGGDGVNIPDTNDNTVGPNNVIANNGGNGVTIGQSLSESISGNSVIGNSITNNSGLGIDLGDDGVTPNAPGGPHSGPNQLQNYPVLTSAYAFGNRTVITGTLNSTPDTDFIIQLYANVVPDPTGFGQGLTYLPTPTELRITTDSFGNATFTATFTAGAPALSYISATATDVEFGTSEFSADLQVFDAFTVVNTNDAGPGSLRQAILNADANPGVDTVRFAIPGPLGSLQVIEPLTPLPPVTDPTVIDATTQPGYAGVPLVAIDGSLATDPFDPQVDGLEVSAGASRVTGLSIVHFSGAGIRIDGNNSSDTGGVLVNANSIGLAPDGTAAGNGTDGIVIAGSSFNYIGGPGGDRNLIAANGGYGIHLTSRIGGSTQFFESTFNAIFGNSIGVDSRFSSAGGNVSGGVFLENGSHNNSVGSDDPQGGNLISGNGGAGILVGESSYESFIASNFIGVDSTGLLPVGNFGDGLQLFFNFRAYVSNNLISANGGNGVSIVQFDGVQSLDTGDTLVNNRIGVGADGASTLGALGNRGDGVAIYGGTGNVIGGSVATGNVISGNFGAGVRIDQDVRNSIVATSADNILQGNVIERNRQDGVRLAGGSTGNLIGGTTADARNILSGNGGAGVALDGQGTSGNAVQGNVIGLTAAGAAEGNGVGVSASNLANDNVIGGLDGGAGNTIASNTGDGVVVAAGVFNVGILTNAIYDNGGAGINLLGSGTGGGNNSQPAPVIALTPGTAGVTIISGTVASSPNARVLLQFFTNASPDPSGFGEGQTFLFQQYFQANANGLVTFSIPVSSVVLANTFLTATATNLPLRRFLSSGETGLPIITQAGNTSEFSRAVGFGQVQFQSQTYTVVARGDATFADVTVTRSGLSDGTSTVNFATANGTAIAGIDYVATSGTLTFGPGVTTQTVAIPILDRLLLSGTSFFTLNLTDPSGGVTLGRTSTTTVTIDQASTLVVTNDDDSGRGSLRRAINLVNNPANAQFAPFTITFNIPGGGVQVIRPLSELPTLNYPVTIDGFSQPGSARNTLAVGDNEVPAILLDGSALPRDSNASGLDIAAGNSVVQGLAIGGFPIAGIVLEFGGGNVVRGNFLGTDATGTRRLANGKDGIYIVDSSNNVIGGATPDARNLISGNGEVGVLIDGNEPLVHGEGIARLDAYHNSVINNYIGTDASGLAALGNGLDGVFIQSASANVIGQPGDLGGNLISGNGSVGVQVFSLLATGNLIQNNLIGSNARGDAGLGNRRDGVYLNQAPANVVGGAVLGQGNFIVANGFSGVDLFQATGSLIQGNTIGRLPDGSAAGNAAAGVLLDNSNGNTVGGAGAAVNTIVNNGFAGIQVVRNGQLIVNPNASGNTIGTNVLSANTSTRVTPRDAALARAAAKKVTQGPHPQGTAVQQLRAAQQARAAQLRLAAQARRAAQLRLAAQNRLARLAHH